MAKVKIKVLSLRQPWAQLLVMGAKQIETRPWKTDYRGPLYIHASQDIKYSVTALAKTEPFSKFIKDVHSLPLGAIVGRVNLDGMMPTEKVVKNLTAQEKAFGDYYPNRHAWFTSKPLEFTTPIRCGGKLSIWEYEINDDYLKKVLSEVLIEEEDYEPKEPDYNAPNESERAEMQARAQRLK